MTYKSYVESGGAQCPKCGSAAIKAAAPPKKLKPDQLQVAMFCATCGARWLALYSLYKAEDL